jgi:ADP-ribosyl-[dinitrogen reductase] hydrolase
MREAVVDAILGCIVGGAIGDAAGAAFEGKPVSLTVPVLLDADWRLTDDTQLTLATCETLTETENPDPALIAASFLRWFRARRLTGLGSSTLKALRDLDVGVHWALAGNKGERTAGNGAAMRIAPLAFCVDPLPEQSRRLIRDICRITHHNDEAYIGALAVVLAIRAAQESRVSLDWIASCLPETSVRERLAGYAALPRRVTLAEAARRYGVSGYVVESVPFALFAAGRVEELGFAGMLKEIIAAGGDTDTNASLAGQVAGTALGFRKLPKELLTRLPQADFVLSIARSFAERLASRRTHAGQVVTRPPRG